MDIAEAKSIMTAVSHANFDRAYAGQQKAAHILLREMTRMEAKVVRYEEDRDCATCHFRDVDDGNQPCFPKQVNEPPCCGSNKHQYYKPWEPKEDV